MLRDDKFGDCVNSLVFTHGLTAYFIVKNFSYNYNAGSFSR